MKKKFFLVKSLIVFLLTGFYCLNLTAQQVRVSVNIPPPYPIHLEDYLTFESQAVITLTNIGNNTLDLKLISNVTDNASINGFVKTSWNPVVPITLNPLEVKVLTGAQLQNHFNNVTANDVSISGLDVNQIIRTETLPEGAYQICVKAFNVANNQQISDDSGCANIFLTNYDPPVVITPMDEGNVQNQNPQFVNLTWTPSGMAGITRYRLEVVDMTLANLFNPNDAFQGQTLVQPYFTKENIIATTHVYSIADPPLTIGHEYAVRVTAYDPQGNLAFKNEGYSAVTTFNYVIGNIIINPNNNNQNDDNPIVINNNPNNQDNDNQINPGFDLQDNSNNNDQPDPPNGACVSETKFNGQIGGAKSSISNGTDVLVGHFVMKNTVFSKSNGGSFNGTGEIKINFLNTSMQVEFQGIQVDNANRFKAGKITAKVTSNSLINNQMSQIKTGIMETLPNAEGLYDKLQEGNRLVSQLNPNNPIDLPISWDDENYNVGIVGIIFEPTEAYVNAILPVAVPQSINGDWLNISTKGLAIHPNGFGAAEVKLSLANDKSIALSNKVSLKIEANEETFVTIDCDGFNNLAIKGAFELSRDIALPLNAQLEVIGNSATKVHVPFELDAADNFENFLLSGLNFSHPFSIPQAQDFVIESAGVTLDFSTAQNSNQFNAAFPNKGNDWIGLYMKNLTLTLPKGFKKQGGGQIELAVNDFMVDKMGVNGTFLAEANPIADGSIAGWDFDLNKVDLKIEESKLAGGGLGGSVKLPLGTQTTLGFWAKISKGNSQGANYEFELDVEDQLDADLFIAKIQLFEGSKINIAKKDGKFEASTLLNGEISVNFNNSPGNSNVSKFDLPSLKFQELVITGKDKPNFTPEFDLKFFALNNQGNIQAKIATFELGLNNLAFETKKEGGQSLVGLTIGLGVSLFGGENNQSTGAGGSTDFTLWANYNKNEKTFKYKNAQLNEISVKGDLGVAYLAGKIAIYSQDDTFGNGFRGELQVEVTGINLGIDVKMQFGKTLANKGNFKYWYFDVMATFPSPGINIPATVASIYGIGGGAWCNMKRTGGVGDPLPPDQYNVANSGGKDGAPTVSGVTFTPQQGVGGFKASVLFGITGSQSAFNGDLTFSIELNTNTLSVNFIQFDGSGYVMQNVNKKPRTEASSLIQVHALLKVNPQNRTFYGSFGATFDVYGLVTGGGTIGMKFQLPAKDHKGNIINEEGLKWHIKIGYWTPGYNPFDDPNRVQAKIGFENAVASLQLKFQGYMMVGNDLPNGLPPLPSYIYDLCKSLGAPGENDLPAAVANAQNLAFALGAGIQLKAGFDFWIVSADLQAEAAFDVLIGNINAECDGKKIGFDGWYAQGQAYAYVSGAGKLFGVPLATIKAGAVLQIKMPNPTWVQGTVVVYIDIAGHDAGDYEGEFERGKQCDVQIDLDPFKDNKLVTNIKPKNKDKEIDPVDPEIVVDFKYRWFEIISVYNPYFNMEQAYFFNQEVTLKDMEGEEIKTQIYKNNKRFTIVPKDNLKPNTEYQLFIYAELKGGGVIELAENHVVKFKTGNMPPIIKMKDLLFSYPLPGQRYFMKESFNGGTPTGILQMKSDMCYIINHPSKKAYAVITDLKTGDEFESPVDKCIAYSQSQIRFQMPQGLKNETIYEVKIIMKKPPQNNNGNGPDANFDLAADSKPHTVFAGLHFKTSKYNNWNQKMNATKVSKVGYIPIHYGYSFVNFTNYDNAKVPVVLLEVGEPFEKYDLEFYEITVMNQYGENQNENKGRLVNLKQNSNWLQSVTLKYRQFNTLSNSERQTISDAIGESGQAFKITRDSGYPYYGATNYPFSPQSSFVWMKNYAFYQQLLKNSGSLLGNDNLLRVKGRLTIAEVNAAKGQNNGGGGMVNLNLNLQVNNGGGGGNGMVNDDLNLNVNGKSYFPIMDFKPHLALKDKALYDTKILQKAMNNGKFYPVFNILKGLGWPTYPKTNYMFYMDVWEARDQPNTYKSYKEYPFNYTIFQN